MKKLVVYTAITRDYDLLAQPPKHWIDQADFVAFVERPLDGCGWQYRPIYSEFKDPCRNAKIHKILPHRFLANYEYSIWIDGCIEIKPGASLEHLVGDGLNGHDLALYRHRRRNCIYQEAAVCLEAMKDRGETISEQMAVYRNEGYPENNGLAECTILVRRHTEAMRRFDEAWHEEVLHHSRRDQLSFNYVAAKTGFRFGYLPGLVSFNEHFSRHRHQTAALPGQA